MTDAGALGGARRDAIEITLRLNGVSVPVVLHDQALARIASAVAPAPLLTSEYVTIPEAASLPRCARQRIEDLLSQRRLTRYKDGRRTLITRQEEEPGLVSLRSRTRGGY